MYVKCKKCGHGFNVKDSEVDTIRSKYANKIPCEKCHSRETSWDLDTKESTVRQNQ